MMKGLMRSLLLAAGLLYALGSFAADGGHDIKVKINGLKNAEIYLGYHFGSKQYVLDTITLDANGEGRFKGDETLEGGIYLVVLPGKTYFEIIVNEQKFSVENSTDDFIKNFKSTGTVENKVFYDDMRFISEKQEKKKELSTKLSSGTDAEKEKAKEELKELDNAVKEHRKKIQEENPNLFYTTLLNAMEEPVVPPSPKDFNGKEIDSLFTYKYYKAHYFDKVALADRRLLRTPIFQNKIDYYLDKVVAQHPDSINAASDFILQKAKKDQEVFQFLVIHILNKYANSKIMGMDAVYVHIVDNYYAKGDATWVDEADLFRITDRAKRLKPTLIGKTAPELTLLDNNGKPQSLKNVKAKYTLIYFYDPDCGHCKKETPKMKEAVDTLQALGVDLKVFAVSVEQEEDKWHKFIKEYGTGDWINVADLKLQNNFRENYDIQSTPKVYLLDENKEILAKRINAEILKLIMKDKEKLDIEVDLPSDHDEEAVFDDNVTH